ncbi:MAG: DUF61 family protein [Thermosphaera sp.]
MREYNDFLTKYLEGELRLVNKHLPYKRLNLCELLKMPVPYVVLADGSLHVFNPDELKKIKELLGDRGCDLTLPIVVEYVQSDGEGFYVVNNPLEAEVISKTLGLPGTRERLVLYRPQIIELRRKLRTTTTILIRPGVK